jgi:hypothetical protein
MIVWYDGFDRIVTAQLSEDYRDTTVGCTIGTGRDSTDGVVGAANSDYMIRDCAPTNAVKGAIGFAMYVSAFPGAKRKIFTLLDATDDAILTLVLRTDGTLDLVFGSDVNNASFITSDDVLDTVAWSYVEVGWELSTSDAFMVIRVNGQLFKSGGGLNSLITTWAAVELHPDEGLDDLYIVDGAGSPRWTLGPQRVWTVPPGAVGDLADWTSSSGVGQVEDIDDVVSDDDATYIWAENDVDVSTFLMAFDMDMMPGAVYAVSVHAVAREDGAGSAAVRPVARTAGVTFTVPSIDEGFALSSVYQYFRYTWLIDPGELLPWTNETVNAMQFGVERNE